MDANDPAPAPARHPTSVAIAADLRRLRLSHAGWGERAIQEACAQWLRQAGWDARMEQRSRSNPRVRFDIWIPERANSDQGVVVEVKKRRPATAAVESQLRRYATTPGVIGVVLVLERAMTLEKTATDGVPVEVVSLQANWGLVC